MSDAILCFYEGTCAFPNGNDIFRIVLPPDQVVYCFVFSGDVMTLSRICGILSRFAHRTPLYTCLCSLKTIII